jgi:hypothetical protein
VKCGLSADKMEEMSVPTYGLSAAHGLTPILRPIYGHLPHRRLQRLRVGVATGGRQNPGFGAGGGENGLCRRVGSVQRAYKEIEGQLSAQRDRLESTYLKDRHWQYTPWLEHYIHHPLVGVLGKKLIWHFEGRTLNIEGIWGRGDSKTCTGSPSRWTRRCR